MKNILKAGGRYKAVILTVLLFTMTASAQIKLRNALDYDGDGKTDVAVVREVPVDNPTNLVWYILNSSDGSFNIFSYGNATDFTAQNDYDGDGKTDLAVWREENGSFYIRNNNGSSNVVKWGNTGDYPIAAYDSH